ncbi:MAG: hypothetical protein ACYDCO_20420 [Armatimonadota bacterium]
MTRLGFLGLALLLLMQVGMAAADLIQKIPANDPARAQLRLLDKYGLLPSSHTTLFGKDAERLTTRYDVAFAMIEPLRLFIALTEIPTEKSPSEERRLHTQAVQILSTLSRDEMLKLLAATDGLLDGYEDLIDKLAPALPKKAGAALQQIRENTLKGRQSSKDNSHLIVRVSVDPNAVPDTHGNPLPSYLSDLEPKPLPFKGAESDSVIARLPANTIETSVHVIFNRLRLTGKIANMPGADWNIIRPDQLSGSAMVRLQYLIGQLNDDLSIGGIVEYHVLRSYEEPGVSNTRTGSVAGLIIQW